MHRYFVAAFLGALAGLILNAAITISCARYPDLPRPDSYRVGVGPLAELQDQLMDRELALYVCKHVASEGMDFLMRGALTGVLLISTFNQLGDCWLRRNLMRLLKGVLTCKYTIAMITGFAIFSVVIYSTNIRCPFLCLSCVLHNGLWWSFCLCGFFSRLLFDLLRRMRRRNLTMLCMFAHVFAIALTSSFLCQVWPDFVNPVACNTASIMGYNTGLYFGAPRCGTINFSSYWIPVVSDSLLLLILAYIEVETSRIVLARHVFEPFLRTFIRRPTFYLCNKICILCAIVMAANCSLADAWVTAMPLCRIFTNHISTPRFICFFKLLSLEAHSNNVQIECGEQYFTGPGWTYCTKPAFRAYPGTCGEMDDKPVLSLDDKSFASIDDYFRSAK